MLFHPYKWPNEYKFGRLGVKNFTSHSRGVIRFKAYLQLFFCAQRLSGVGCQVFPGGWRGVWCFLLPSVFQAAELGVRAAIAVNTHVEMVKQIAAEASGTWEGSSDMGFGFLGAVVLVQ